MQTLCQTDKDVFLLLDGKDDEGLHDLLLEHADAGVDGPTKIDRAHRHFAIKISTETKKSNEISQKETCLISLNHILNFFRTFGCKDIKP